MKGRRAFFSGAAKFAAMGGAAVVLPREALSEISKSSQLREVTEEIYIEESYELSPEQVMGLMNRIKELEQAIANPSWFQGHRGMQGVPGCSGRDGQDGLTVDQVQEMIFLQACSVPTNRALSISQLPDGSVEFYDPNTGAVKNVNPTPTRYPQYDLSGNELYTSIQWGNGEPIYIPSKQRVERLADCVDYLMRREIDEHRNT